MNSKFQPGEETFDDVAGHRVLRGDETSAPDDTEGHRLGAWNQAVGDDDDTEGHRRVLEIRPEDEDTEGHRAVRGRPSLKDGADADAETEGHRLVRVTEDDDEVEGHRLGAWNQAVGDDDVEGHRMQ